MKTLFACAYLPFLVNSLRFEGERRRTNASGISPVNRSMTSTLASLLEVNSSMSAHEFNLDRTLHQSLAENMTAAQIAARISEALHAVASFTAPSPVLLEGKMPYAELSGITIDLPALSKLCETLRQSVSKFGTRLASLPRLAEAVVLVQNTECPSYRDIAAVRGNIKIKSLNKQALRQGIDETMGAMVYNGLLVTQAARKAVDGKLDSA